MNGKKAKKLRAMAREEMAGSPDREAVVHRNKRGATRVINEPLTARGMTIQLKKQYAIEAKKGNLK